MTRQNMLLRRAAEAQVHQVLGMTHRNLLLPREGGFLLIEATIPPGCGSPPHVHERDVECFHLLAGRLVVQDGDAERTLLPGDTCRLLAGRPHGFQNRHAEVARALVIVTPGDAAHDFFGELDCLAAAGPVGLAAVEAAAARHALRIGNA